MICKFKVHLRWFHRSSQTAGCMTADHKSLKMQSNLLDFISPDEHLKKDKSVFLVNDPPEFLLWQILQEECPPFKKNG